MLIELSFQVEFEPLQLPNAMLSTSKYNIGDPIQRDSGRIRLDLPFVSQH